MEPTQWTHAQPGVVWVARICPGHDLKDELEKWVQENHISAACILSAVGSLSIASLRFAGSASQWNEGRDWEVVSLSGLLGREGVHLHMSVSDKTGATFGGHLMTGSTVRTTVEVVIQEMDGLVFHRIKDEQTEFQELKIGKK